MAERRQTPQEKKALSYERDTRRPLHGISESDKGRRKTIPAAKARPRRADRRAARQVLDGAVGAPAGDVEETAEVQVADHRPRGAWFRKEPDQPLGVVLPRRQENRERRHGTGKARRGAARLRAAEDAAYREQLERQLADAARRNARPPHRSWWDDEIPPGQVPDDQVPDQQGPHQPAPDEQAADGERPGGAGPGAGAP